MQTNQNFLVPEYIKDFKCVGKNCIDSCCIGWDIAIDKKTCKKYEDSSNKEIKLISQKFLVKKDPKSNIAYSTLVNQNNCCPFLSEDKLCNAYNLLGKENLSISCSTYPRVIKKFDKVGFIAGTLSCPEIARLCLSKSNSKIKRLKKNKLLNIFNSNNIHTFEFSKNLSVKILGFIEEIFSQINSPYPFFDALNEIIILYGKIFKNNSYKPFSKNENEKIKENFLHKEAGIIARICFSNFKDSSRFTRICRESADKSKYFNISETEFVKQFVYNYKTKFNKFIKKNDYIYKNFFLNEFIKDIEKIFVSPDSFDDLIREIILFLSLSNFLLVCQLFESNKRLTVKSYGEVLSAVIKKIQSSRTKTDTIRNFLKKLDNNTLFARLVDLY